MIIACPEHYGSLSAWIKNAIDWLFRSATSIGGRVFFMMGACPGRSGCARMHLHGSCILESEGGLVFRQRRALLPQVETFIDGKSDIANPAVTDMPESTAATVIQVTGQLSK